jgi:hypothetical protein
MLRNACGFKVRCGAPAACEILGKVAGTTAGEGAGRRVGEDWRGLSGEVIAHNLVTV